MVHTGQVLVGLKEAAFEASSPQRHCKELCDILSTRSLNTQPIYFVCIVLTTGSPSFPFSYLLSKFLALDLDFLCAARTPPYHSQLKGSCQF